jgi:DNA-directed RNA polymerase subunit L
MNPVVSKIVEDKDALTFTLSGVNVSIANGLRRITEEIPTVVFRTTPHEANRATFEVNTTRMNNEIIKQRLSCIPIMSKGDFPLEEYTMVVNKQNKSTSIEYVTTEDFKVVHIATKKIDVELTRKLFPPNPVTKDYTELVRLLPRVSETIDGEQLSLSCTFDIGTAKQDSAFNVVHTCVYGNTQDMAKVKSVWAEKKVELSKIHNAEELAFVEKDWQLLDAKRFYLPDSFDFNIESTGQYTNMEIIERASRLMIEKLARLQETIQSETSIVSVSETTIPNSYDIVLKNEGYTLGKVVEYVLYELHYNKTLTFCGFRKPHPHIDESIIRLGFKNQVDKVTVISYIVNAAKDAITVYEKINKVFNISN